uniref:hypothetical protein n=1 Tax=Sporolactobacillus inulinus TaxID=2078 RepID=UPI0021CD0B20|nr:hypothetical protein [Sporolactobacillus inulinus]
MNYEKVFQALNSSYGALDGDHAALDLLRQTASSLDSIRDLDPELNHFLSLSRIASICWKSKPHRSEIIWSRWSTIRNG